MNKAEFVEIISKRINLPKAKCNVFIDHFKELILEVCAKGESINLRNFGKFSMEQTKARKFLNPQTMRYYICQPKKMISFKGFKNFKYAIK